MVTIATSTPSTIVSATGACAWPSIVNVTVPPGVPVPALATTAVKVTAWPTVEGLAEAVSRVRVASSGAALTTCVNGTDELPRKLPVGVNTAVIASEPRANVDVV